MTAARSDTWMPIYWGDYARDTGHLNSAGHGAYLMLIKHYWCTGGPLADDDDELWRIACCDSKREWLKIRPKIARLFKVDAGCLRHKRIDEEIKRARARTEAKANAGRKGANKRWHSDDDANGTAIAQPSVRHRQTDAKSQSQSQSHKDSAPNGAGRATRLASDWTLPSEWRDWALTEGWPASRVEAEAEKFGDYWHAAGGQNARKHDWLATWRNWMRKAPKTDDKQTDEAKPIDRAAVLARFGTGQESGC